MCGCDAIQIVIREGLRPSSRTLTESYRAAPFQGWSVSPLHPVRSTAKNLNPATALREHENLTPYRQNHHTPGQQSAVESGRDRAANPTRIRARIGGLLTPGKRSGNIKIFSKKMRSARWHKMRQPTGRKTTGNPSLQCWKGLYKRNSGKPRISHKLDKPFRYKPV